MSWGLAGRGPQLLEQQQQRTGATLRYPRRWVAVCAEVAGMESKVANPSQTVNSVTGLAAMFHLIRLLRPEKGLFRRKSGDVAHQPHS